MKNILCFLSFFIVAFTQIAFAQEENNTTKNPILTSKFQVGVGMFIPTQTVKFGLDASSSNTEINFGKSFDFNNHAVRPNMSFDWRFSKHWKLAAEYFNANYSKNSVLEEDIEIGDGDYTFEEGSYVKIGYKINLYRVYVGRVISSGLKHELGGGLGVHILNVGPFIEGDVIINGNDNEFKTAAISATAPLPNIALWYHFAPTQKWAFSARVDWFGLSIDEYSGSLWDISPSVRYQIIKNMAVALDYRYFKVNANVNKDLWNGSFDLSFSGPTVTLFANF
jgi:hypothetical protein